MNLFTTSIREDETLANAERVILMGMANHKRGRPKNRRAGCLLCKPWKMNGYGPSRLDAEQFSSHRRRIAADQAIRAASNASWNRRPPGIPLGENATII